MTTRRKQGAGWIRSLLMSFAVLIGLGGLATAAAAPYPSACIVHGARSDQTQVDPACLAARAEAAGWPDYDSIAIGEHATEVELAKREAAEEAAGWPDYDSTAIGEPVNELEMAGANDAELEAILSACTIHGARTDQTRVDADCILAAREAQDWPDYDSIAIGERAKETELAKQAAEEEAAAWPDYDSVAIGERATEAELAKQAAAEEAAGWPDYDTAAFADGEVQAQLAQANATREHPHGPF